MMQSYKNRGVVYSTILKTITDYQFLNTDYRKHSPFYVSFIEQAHNKSIQQIGKENRQKKLYYYLLKDCLSFIIPYDYSNILNYASNIPKERFILSYVDETEYNYIDKRKTYIDVSLFVVLKRLHLLHKINRFDYKKAIHNLKQNKPLPEKTYNNVVWFYKSLKSKSRKNTLIYLNLNQKQNTTKTNYKNNLYSVRLKKNISENSFISPLIEKEAQSRIYLQNQFQKSFQKSYKAPRIV